MRPTSAVSSLTPDERWVRFLERDRRGRWDMARWRVCSIFCSCVCVCVNVWRNVSTEEACANGQAGKAGSATDIHHKNQFRECFRGNNFHERVTSAILTPTAFDTQKTTAKTYCMLYTVCNISGVVLASRAIRRFSAFRFCSSSFSRASRDARRLCLTSSTPVDVGFAAPAFDMGGGSSSQRWR